MNKAIAIFALILLTLAVHAGTTVLWDASIDGTLDTYPYSPTNADFVIHPIGSATDDVDIIESSVTLTPNGGDFIAQEDGFWFLIPAGRQMTGLSFTVSCNYPGYLLGGGFASATGPLDGAGELGYYRAYPGTNNNIFHQMSLLALSAGVYSICVFPDTTLENGYQLTNTGTASYTLSILTAPLPVLQISQMGNQMLLTWNTNNATDFSLQTTTSLIPPVSWTAVTNIPTIVGNQFVVTNAEASGGQLFRLAANL